MLKFWLGRESFRLYVDGTPTRASEFNTPMTHVLRYPLLRLPMLGT